MPVVDRLLEPDEALLYSTRPHTAALAPALARALALVAICGAAVLAAALLDASRPLRQAVALVGSAVGALVVAHALRAVWRWDRTVLALTTRQILLIERGPRLRSRSVPLAAIHRLGVDQSVCGRLLGYGTLTFADGHARRALRYVPRPRELSDLILQRTAA
jgi:hypothetical protein